MYTPYEDYKDRYEGRLWVCGNAPSVSECYGLLEDEYTFACNFIFIWPEMPFYPTFYGATEPTDHVGQWEYVDEISRDIAHRFVLSRDAPDPARNRWVYLPKIQPGGARGQMDIEGCRPDAPFSTAGTTPLNIGVQFGSYMGFKQIYIIGMELSDGHVYEIPDGDTVAGKDAARRGWNDGRKHNVVKSFGRAVSDLSSRGVELVNCTPKGIIADNFGYTPVKDILC